MTSKIFLSILSLAGSVFGGCSSDDSNKTADTTTARHTQPVQPAPSDARSVTVDGVDLTGVGYELGNPKASVVIVNFSDFGCPFCGSFARETQPSLDREFIRTGKVFFKYVPFVMGMFPNGDVAARAAECAAEQGKFWAMHDSLYASQKEWKRSSAPADVFQRYASGLGINPARFAGCYADRHTDGRTAMATNRADRLRIRATPTFYVNGQMIEGALPLTDFRRLVNEELERK